MRIFHPHALPYIIRSLKSTGKGAVILPHGVLCRGNSEAEMRRNMIRRGSIKGIIGLPPNLFYGTGIPAGIIVLDKENAAGRSGIFTCLARISYSHDGYSINHHYTRRCDPFQIQKREEEQRGRIRPGRRQGRVCPASAARVVPVSSEA